MGARGASLGAGLSGGWRAPRVSGPLCGGGSGGRSKGLRSRACRLGGGDGEEEDAAAAALRLAFAAAPRRRGGGASGCGDGEGLGSMAAALHCARARRLFSRRSTVE